MHSTHLPSNKRPCQETGTSHVKAEVPPCLRACRCHIHATPERHVTMCSMGTRSMALVHFPPSAAHSCFQSYLTCHERCGILEVCPAATLHHCGCKQEHTQNRHCRLILLLHWHAGYSILVLSLMDLRSRRQEHSPAATPKHTILRPWEAALSSP